MKGSHKTIIVISLTLAISIGGFVAWKFSKKSNPENAAAVGVTNPVSAEAPKSDIKSVEGTQAVTSIKSAIPGAVESKLASSPPAAPGALAPAAPVSASAPTASKAPAVPVAPVAIEAPSCFTLTFKHKPMEGHADDEDCSAHRNLIKVARADLNPKSMCVRVNDVPVAFTAVKDKAGQFLIGPIAGPKSKITASFCVGKAHCADECKIPVAKKDEFLDALGASEHDGKGKMGQWEADENGEAGDINDKIDAGVKKELVKLNDNANSKGGSTYIFADWLQESEIPACANRKTASR